jgi:hypothetical protein
MWLCMVATKVQNAESSLDLDESLSEDSDEEGDDAAAFLSSAHHA